MELESSQAYANFRAWCPRKEVSVGVLHPIPWRYYDWGPRAYAEPLVCLHSLIGSAESFYQQLVSLAPRGYRVLSVQIPVYWTVAEFCDAFHAFLDTVPHRRVHLYGAGLGGFLAMHYAARKPDRVASLVLTHSFLSTANLNLRIPYSAPVLRWLPEFLLRATMSAILPKGRVSLDMANAAELAIGHTLACPRDALASRMALSVTNSTVVNRVHIPQTSITLIDALDRQPQALELSELTASQFPDARRALLKSGGDFPYISAPDDVNVHLVVHMRRNGADPISDVPVPVPARPMILPASTRRRRAEEARRAKENKNSSQDPADAERKERIQKRSREELQKAARAMVAADERSKIERYAFEISGLREFLPGRHDSYLAAVLETCDGNLDMAISNALEDQYDDEFYEVLLHDAVEKTVVSLREMEEEAATRDEKTEDKAGGNNEDESQAPAAVEHVDENAALGSSPRSVLDEDGNEEDLQSRYRGRSRQNDPLGETQFLLNSGLPLEGDVTAVDGEDKPVDATDNGRPLMISPGTKSSQLDSDSTDLPDDDPMAGLRIRSSPNSAMSSVDLGASEEFRNSEQGDGSVGEGSSIGDAARNDADPGSAGRSQRRTRRKSFPPEAPDGVGAYVTSERVGMRSRGPLVGRGPAPFNSAPTDSTLSPGEGWMRTPLEKEDDAASRFDVDNKTHVSLSSGASLLDAGENPLGLPGEAVEYSERSRYNVHPSREHDRRYGREATGRSAGTTSKRPAGDAERSALPSTAASDDGSLVGSNAVYTGETGSGPSGEGDEWEKFRGRERGLAGAIEPPKGLSERTFNASFDSVEAAVNGENEEAARLREWRMSAQAASKNVHR